jgi:hypothetical protein
VWEVGNRPHNFQCWFPPKDTGGWKRQRYIKVESELVEIESETERDRGRYRYRYRYIYIK